MKNTLTDLNIDFISEIKFIGFDKIRLAVGSHHGNKKYGLTFSGVINFNYSIGDVEECQDDILSILDIQYKYDYLSKKDLSTYTYDSIPEEFNSSRLHILYLYEDMILTLISRELEIKEMT